MNQWSKTSQVINKQSTAYIKEKFSGLSELYVLASKMMGRFGASGGKYQIWFAMEERKTAQNNGWIVKSAVGIGLHLKDKVHLVGNSERVWN